MTREKGTNLYWHLSVLGTTTLCLLLGWGVLGSETEPALLSISVGMVWDQNVESHLVASGAQPFPSSYAYGRAHAFDIDAEYEQHMNKGAVSEELRKAFAKGAAGRLKKSLQLSKNASIKIAGKGPVWLVTDTDNRRSFYLQKGKDVATRRKDVLRVYLDSPFWSISRWTLPNGLSVSIHTDKLCEDDPLRVTGLAFANSTMLFACKGESWHAGLAVELNEDSCHLDNLATREPKPKEGAKATPATVYLWKGMARDAAVKGLNSAKLKQLPMNATWTRQFPKTGRWFRYSLDGDTELAVNLDSGRDRRSPTVRWIIIEATKPTSPDKDPRRYRIECELVDLKKPLKDGWHWAFREAWSWDPSDPDRMRRLRATGQRRWTRDQLPKDKLKSEPSHPPESAVGPKTNGESSPPTR